MQRYLDAHCPDCDALSLRIEWRLVAKPLGSWSLAGMQPKVSAVSTPFVICDSCGLELQGKR